MIICLYLSVALWILLFLGMLIQKKVFARIIFLNSLTNITILVISVLGSFKYQGLFLDIAFIYALLGFIANQGILRYFIKVNKFAK